MVAPIRRALDDCEAQLWLTAPRWAGRPTAAVGRIVGEDAQALAALLNDLAQESAAEGAEWLLGPLDGDTWHSYRLAIGGTGRPTFALEPPSAPAIETALAVAGFAPVLFYESRYAPLSDRRIPRLGSHRLTVRPFDPSAAEAELRTMHRLALAAFDRAPLFTPIDFLARMVRDAAVAGEVAGWDPDLLTAVIVGSVVQAATFRIYGRIDRSLTEMADEIVAMCLSIATDRKPT